MWWLVGNKEIQILWLIEWCGSENFEDEITLRKGKLSHFKNRVRRNFVNETKSGHVIFLSKGCGNHDK